MSASAAFGTQALRATLFMDTDNIAETVGDGGDEAVAIESGLRDEGVVLGEVRAHWLLQAEVQQIGGDRSADKGDWGVA